MAAGTATCRAGRRAAPWCPSRRWGAGRACGRQVDPTPPGPDACRLGPVHVRSGIAACLEQSRGHNRDVVVQPDAPPAQAARRQGISRRDLRSGRAVAAPDRLLRGAAARAPDRPPQRPDADHDFPQQPQPRGVVLAGGRQSDAADGQVAHGQERQRIQPRGQPTAANEARLARGEPAHGRGSGRTLERGHS